MKKRDCSNKRTIVLIDPILKKLEKIWVAECKSESFGFWFRGWLEKKLK